MSKQVMVELKNDLNELVRLREWFSECAGPLSIDPKTLFHLNLVCDELITNTIVYGYKTAEERQIRVCLTVGEQAIELVITDDGIAFDPLSIPEADTKEALDDRKIGGLGIHFVREVMDEVTYERTGDQNTIRLKKYGQRPAEAEGSA
ncbi:ATP-binding protein [Paenibacillus piri]|uniref:ATP-binding protein n=1 Tax=Paenibacillus piri TaxID=2547395 RepID=A0A4V6PIH9_9BACL|nr:ATP-binding protein [Paenibacillus piri]TDF97144.1 ATP-binding protein [Paenibacillus piri]